jgi:hypothetical protein
MILDSLAELLGGFADNLIGVVKDGTPNEDCDTEIDLDKLPLIAWVDSEVSIDNTDVAPTVTV